MLKKSFEPCHSGSSHRSSHRSDSSGSSGAACAAAATAFIATTLAAVEDHLLLHTHTEKKWCLNYTSLAVSQGRLNSIEMKLLKSVERFIQHAYCQTFTGSTVTANVIPSFPHAYNYNIIDVSGWNGSWGGSEREAITLRVVLVKKFSTLPFTFKNMKLCTNK